MLTTERIQWFTKKMEELMKENNKDWSNIPTWFIIEKLKEAIIKLEYALEQIELSETQVAFETAIREAASIAKNAMIIADILEKRMKESPIGD